ncbi:Fic family protein [Raineyella antarctica]|nr:Fic family protein [Raineyella antarctica]
MDQQADNHAPTPADPAAVWPALGHGEADWDRPDSAASRRQRLANRGTFRYAVVPHISALVPPVSPDVVADADEAVARMEAFDKESAGWGVPFSSVLLRSESAASSQIEHLTANARRIALAALGDSSRPDATMIARNTAALRAAVDLADRISANTIRAMHERLDGGDDPDNAGQFRREWVWIGGQSPVAAAYVGVHPDAVESDIVDLVGFIRRDDIQPLVQAAIAHAQFETIHPFTDGNGRTGRALVSAILRRRGVTRHLSVPISSGLLADTDAYFAALTAYRQGEIEPIIERFSYATRRALDNAAVLRDDAQALREAAIGSAQRRTVNLLIFAELCASEPAFTAQMVTDRGVSPSSAYRILDRLVAVGVIRQEKPINGATVWTVPGLTEALDRFAARAGRRIVGRP